MNKPAFTIITDGTRKGTQVLNSSGEPIEGVTGFTFNMDSEGVPELEVRLSMGSMQVASHEGMLIASCPSCGQGVAHMCEGMGG